MNLTSNAEFHRADAEPKLHVAIASRFSPAMCGGVAGYARILAATKGTGLDGNQRGCP